MLKVLPIMLKNSPIMLALCFMLSSPYYAENYAGIIYAGLLLADLFIRQTFFRQMLRKSNFAKISPCQNFPLYDTSNCTPQICNNYEVNYDHKHLQTMAISFRAYPLSLLLFLFSELSP